MARRIKPRFKNLAALISAWTEGALTREELDTCLGHIRMGVGLSKRDKALGIAMEGGDDPKDGPAFWAGYHRGLVDGYEGARLDVEKGIKLLPAAELAEQARFESGAELPKEVPPS